MDDDREPCEPVLLFEGTSSFPVPPIQWEVGGYDASKGIHKPRDKPARELLQLEEYGVCGYDGEEQNEPIRDRTKNVDVFDTKH